VLIVTFKARIRTHQKENTDPLYRKVNVSEDCVFLIPMTRF
jgi:hypothetical protein